MDNLKEVYFYKYCNTCKFRSTYDDDNPCDECLSIPARENSHKPEYYEEDETNGRD